MTLLSSIVLVLVATTIGSFGPIFLKKASADFKFHPKHLVKNKYLWIGLIFYGLGTMLFIPALRGGELSVLYPLVALAYVLVSFWSQLWLGERMNKLKWTGVALILLGVALIGLGA